MNETDHSAISIAVKRIFKALTRVLLRQRVSFAAVSNLLAEAYVEVAAENFAIEGRTQSISRIATLTGMSRKRIAEITSSDSIDLAEADKRYNRAARVVSGWIRESAYLDSRGNPKTLKYEGDDFSFSTLVKEHSGDIPPRAILDELIQVGIVKETSSGNFKLLGRAYVPSEATDQKLQILGVDVSDLIDTIEHNITTTEEAFFQRKVAYNAIPTAQVPQLKQQLEKKAQHALEQMDRVLSKHDIDMNSKIPVDEKSRIGIGIYYFEEHLDDE
ncbi:MAG: DUF6502 family protein [Pseudomonadota bacterium]